jgi:hypothetical protein
MLLVGLIAYTFMSAELPLEKNSLKHNIDFQGSKILLCPIGETKKSLIFAQKRICDKRAERERTEKRIVSRATPESAF